MPAMGTAKLRCTTTPLEWHWPRMRPSVSLPLPVPLERLLAQSTLAVAQATTIMVRLLLQSKGPKNLQDMGLVLTWQIMHTSCLPQEDCSPQLILDILARP